MIGIVDCKKHLKYAFLKFLKCIPIKNKCSRRLNLAILFKHMGKIVFKTLLNWYYKIFLFPFYDFGLHILRNVWNSYTSDNKHYHTILWTCLWLYIETKLFTFSSSFFSALFFEGVFEFAAPSSEFCSEFDSFLALPSTKEVS